MTHTDGTTHACRPRRLSLALAIAALSAAAPALAAEAASGDATVGARLFLQCRACHVVGKDEPAGVGPNLHGVMGSLAGQRPGYNYSTALAASKIVWTPATMDAWLTQPTALVAGTKMAFQGVASQKARQNLIAYLLTLDPKSKVAREQKPRDPHELAENSNRPF